MNKTEKLVYSEKFTGKFLFVLIILCCFCFDLILDILETDKKNVKDVSLPMSF